VWPYRTPTSRRIADYADSWAAHRASFVQISCEQSDANREGKPRSLNFTGHTWR
jgi:hypothetical protein